MSADRSEKVRAYVSLWATSRSFGCAQDDKFVEDAGERSRRYGVGLCVGAAVGEVAAESEADDKAAYVGG